MANVLEVTATYIFKVEVFHLQHYGIITHKPTV